MSGWFSPLRQYMPGWFGGEAPNPPTEHPQATTSPAQQTAPSAAQPNNMPGSVSQTHVAPPTTLEGSIDRLGARQFAQLEVKARDLHQITTALATKIRTVDDLLSRVTELSQGDPNGAVDCRDGEIVRLTATLHHQGFPVPTSNGRIIQKSDLGRIFTDLGNRRSGLADELREHSQEFQQCSTERNNIVNFLNSLLSVVHQTKSKMAHNISYRAS